MKFIDKFDRAFPYIASAILVAVVLKLPYPSIVDEYKEKSAKEEEEALDTTLATVYFAYYDYLDAIASKMKEVNEDRDILRDYAIYEAMLERGYFSYGEFGSLDSSVEYPKYFGANVAASNANALHVAHNMADVFEALGYKTKVVVGKRFKKDMEKPDHNNSLLVYVSDGSNSYLLAPSEKTIYVRRENKLYYTVESQEDNIVCFEPDVNFSNDYYGDYGCFELAMSFGNEFKNHWELLREYRKYQEEAQAYIDEFANFEKEELLQYEEVLNELYTRKFIKKKR